MRITKRRLILVGVSVLVILAATPLAMWMALAYSPADLPAMAKLPPAQRKKVARRFVAQSLQLRNDIINEPTWEASFSDQEVNAWLAEDLVTEFADQIPTGVQNPRVAFEPDRVILAFDLEDGALCSKIWIVARPHVPEANTLALTLETVRAGVVPIPAGSLLDRITAHARAHGLDIEWQHEGGLPVALIRYRADETRPDVVLERLHVLNGQILLVGRSERNRAATSLRLPDRRTLQSTFRNQRNSQPASFEVNRPTRPVSLRDSSTRPRS